jgi:cullin 3
LFRHTVAEIFQVEIRFQEEDRRTHHYLSSQTALPLLKILKDNLLTPHLPNVISKADSGLATMVDNNNFEDLSRLFKLCSMVPTGLHSIKSALKDSIVLRGKVINEGSISEEDVDEENDAREIEGRKYKGKGKVRSPSTGVQPAMLWVQDVLDLKDKFDIIWKTSLQTNRDVESCINGVGFLFPGLQDSETMFVAGLRVLHKYE